MSKRSFKNFVEQELGSLPQFFIYTILEWSLITILFIDGVLAFLSNQFAKFFDLNTPCLLCTRIDHVLVPQDPEFYYNDSICDSHKKKISSLAYCHVHRKLSEIKHMCEGCLLSFATEKESDCDTYKSLIGILHKDLELLIDDERELPLAFKKDDNFVQTTTTTNLVDHKSNNIKNESLKEHCSCCGELLKIKSEKLPKNNNAFIAPAPSPRVSYNKLSENESEFKDLDVDKTPSFVRGGNKFFGIPLSDSAQNSPRWSVRPLRKSLLEKTENASEMANQNGDSILNQLKKEVRLDKKSLIDLYMELDEERSASAIAANNAMAMITRLQAEKAAVQMEALQYQRMMDEQAEYDQEALQSMSTELAKREEEVKELEAEFEAYREKYGCLTDEDNAREEFLEEHGNVSAVSSSNHEENGANIYQNGSHIIAEESRLESTAEEEEGIDSKEGIVKELTAITERLSALQSNGELLKHIADVLDQHHNSIAMANIPQVSSYNSKLFFLAFCITLFLNPTFSLYIEPNPIQDFCVADLQATPSNNAFPCKQHVTSEDFFFSGLNVPFNVSNPRGLAANVANVLTFPGLNKMRISMFNVAVAAGAANSPHSHPGYTEAGFILEGSVLIGFLTTNYTLYSKVVGPGDMFVVPLGLIHYEWNIGKTDARFLAVVTNELPSEVVVPNTLLVTEPAIPDAVLMKAFKTDGKTIKMLKSKFTKW
ncbi:hypothetical protein AALP_AA2G189100 [Arabis alpina]|uniref:GTD-binding domain-containing protein n=1 Tax=Arabis alpina TaxID=50452 RepID=A0A087HIG7_ARAAL|nr:hypothetical protein AALP_AA2G189100 [Arabis alpina]